MITEHTGNWYNLTAAEALDMLKTGQDGLSQAEGGRRLATYGPNELRAARKVSPWLIFLEQFKSILIIILIVAVILSFILGEIVDASVILIIVVFASVLGFIQEYRAERSLEALRAMAAPTAEVIRDGKGTSIAARDLVPGDIILVKLGGRLPADGRLIESVNLKVDEAALTGESLGVEKMDAPISGEAAIGDRRNMVFAGTNVTYGRGRAVVTETGMATEFGQIARLLQEVQEERTPLQVNLDRLGRWIAVGALGLCAVLAAIGVLRGHTPLEMVLWGVSLAVAAVPEALPAVVTVSLSLGVQRMARRHALVRRLPAVETLGSTDYICSDKTGTLTQEQMTVRQVYVDGRLLDVTGGGYEPEGEFRQEGRKIEPQGEPTLMRLLSSGVLCNDTSLTSENGIWDISGDPTEGALVVLAVKAGLDVAQLRSESPRCQEIPFSSETKRMTTVHRHPQGPGACAKGAVEVILNDCRLIEIQGRVRELADSDRAAILAAGQQMAESALRVLGLAYKPLEDCEAGEAVSREMVFLGLAGMIDPPRPEVKLAIQECCEAGIRTVMITGDYKVTAMAIARELGILKTGLAFTGAEIDRMSQPQFEGVVEKIEVYARVSPAHKLRVVDALTRKNHVVAMTGNGVNDAPALKKADIGIAMGITGTDVTKEAANMVLTDDNFASIVAAVEEGRGIFVNIKKYLVYLLSSNLGEILLMAGVILFAPLLGLAGGVIPLLAIQILFVNLVTDGLPAIALAVDPSEPDLMLRRPRPRNQSIFTTGVVVYMLVAGAWTAGSTMLAFVWAMHTGRSLMEAQSLCFVTLILVEFFNAFNCRSLDYSIFRIGVFKNRWLVWSVFLQVLVLLAIVYLQPLQAAFKTHSLNGEEWLVAVGLSLTIFLGLEIFKLVKRVVRPPEINPMCG